MYKLGQYLLANNLRAYLAVLLSLLIPVFPFHLIAALIIALVTLQRGSVVGLGAVAWALLPSIATNIKFSQLEVYAIYYDSAFILCLVTWGLAVFLRYSRNWSRVLEFAAAMAIPVLVGVSVLPADLLATVMMHLKMNMLEIANQFIQINATAREQLQQISAYEVVGFLYASLIFSALMVLVIARMWQFVLVTSQQKRSEFYHIRMGRVIATLAGLVIVVAISTQKVLPLALVPIACVLFVFTGLSLVRFVVSTKIKSALTGAGVFVVIFLLILYVPQIAVAGLTILCIADSWIDLRRTKILA